MQVHARPGQVTMPRMKLRVAADVVFREVAGEAVLLNLKTGLYYGLDEVGTRAWTLLAADGEVDRVVRALAGEFDVEESRLRSDVDALVKQLLEGRLVSPVLE